MEHFSVLEQGAGQRTSMSSPERPREENIPFTLPPPQIQNGSITVAYYRYFRQGQDHQKNPASPLDIPVSQGYQTRLSVEAEIISGYVPL